MSLVQREMEQLFTVFEGSAAEDVYHARQLWSSLSLLPPLESCLVSTDIRQRLPMSRPRRDRMSAVEPQSDAFMRQQRRQEERRRYETMDWQRRHVLPQLAKQWKQLGE